MKESYLRDAIDTDKVQRALVVKLRHHGDVLLTSPVFSALAHSIPGVETDALVYADTAPMLELHPAIANVYKIDRQWKQQGLKAQWHHERHLINALRGRHYDLVIHLTEHARGARLARRLKPRYSVARRYRRKRGRWWRSSFTHIYSVPDNPRHTVEVHLDALRRMGIYPDTEQRRLSIVPGPAATRRSEQLMRQQGLQANRYLLVHPTSRWMFKGWSQQGFAETLNGLHEAGHKLVLTAAPDDREMNIIRQIIERSHAPVIDLSGQLNPKELAAMIGKAACFIGVDSLPMHIAAATGTPCVALFGPSDELAWGPWMVPHRLISQPLSCRPCGMDGCGNGKVSDCLLSIEPSRVVSAVSELLTA